MAQEVRERGFALCPEVISPNWVSSLVTAISAIRDGSGVYERNGVYAVRGLLERVVAVGELARSSETEAIVQPVLGTAWRPVRALFFDKTPVANWKVPWHQDLTIAVKERMDTPGYGPWSIKGNVPHVQPPVEVLEQMVAVRFALDENYSGNGPLRVLPGTHRMGRLRPDRIAEFRSALEEVTCCVPLGGVLVLRPLILHASSPMTSGLRRRVIHIEFAGCDLPGGLEWHS